MIRATRLLADRSRYDSRKRPCIDDLAYKAPRFVSLGGTVTRTEQQSCLWPDVRPCPKTLAITQYAVKGSRIPNLAGPMYIHAQQPPCNFQGIRQLGLAHSVPLRRSYLGLAANMFTGV